jgi:uncharacterized protein YozE (UPF0346 family)
MTVNIQSGGHLYMPEVGEIEQLTLEEYTWSKKNHESLDCVSSYLEASEEDYHSNIAVFQELRCSCDVH